MYSTLLLSQLMPEYCDDTSPIIFRLAPHANTGPLLMLYQIIYQTSFIGDTKLHEASGEKPRQAALF